MDKQTASNLLSFALASLDCNKCPLADHCSMRLKDCAKQIGKAAEVYWAKEEPPNLLKEQTYEKALQFIEEEIKGTKEHLELCSSLNSIGPLGLLDGLRSAKMIIQDLINEAEKSDKICMSTLEGR